MKKIFAFSLLLATGAIAAQAASLPDLECVDRNGITYKVYKKYGEIKSYSKSGALIASLDGMTAKTEYNYLYFIQEEGNVVAAFRLEDFTATGAINKRPVTCKIN